MRQDELYKIRAFLSALRVGIYTAFVIDSPRPCSYNLPMPVYDLCLPWYWKYDEDFVAYVDMACRANGLNFCQVTPANLLEFITCLYSGLVTFRALLDRAVDDLRFEPLRRFAREHNLLRINPLEQSHWAEDKATMHLELIQAGIYTPHTLLLAPFIQEPILPNLDLTPLGSRFVVKPAVGGGGEGVHLNAASPDDIQKARLEYPDRKYLVQATIEPQILAGRAAWFRVFYVRGDCIACWWDPSTHVYATLQPEEELQFNLQPLRTVTGQIARVCKLDWFSTEIALTRLGHFVVVDYVNDGIDTRTQSKARDGVPDEILKYMAGRLVSMVPREEKPEVPDPLPPA